MALYSYEIKTGGYGTMEDKEIWKDIEGFEGFYQVSNFGRVRSLGGWCGTSKRKARIRKLNYTHDGYLKLRLMYKGKDITCRVHRLVADAFIPNPNNYETVNHIDGNKENNKVENLEWCDRGYQMEHAYKLKLKISNSGADNIHSKLTEDDIKYIRSVYKKYSRDFNTVSLAKKFGVSDRVIGLIVRNMSYKNVK